MYRFFRTALFSTLLWSAFACEVPDSSTAYVQPRPDAEPDCTTDCGNNTPAPVCGNGVVETGEACEGGTRACAELGSFEGGTATCSTSCQWDLSACEEPVDRLQDPTCGTNLGNQERDEFRSTVEERVLGDSPTPAWVRLSWNSDPSISMTVTWTTRDSSAATMTKSTVLRVSRNPDMSGHREVSSLNSGVMIGSARTLPYSSAWKTVHVAEICGLDPDTVYYYQAGGIGADGSETFSPTYHFRTAPDPRLPYDQHRFTFIALGDSRGAPDKLGRTMRRAFEEENPLFFSFGGDFVEDGTTQRQWEEMFDATSDVMPYVPVLPVPGNHEKSSLNYYAQFSLPGDERWYGYVIGNSVFANLDDCWSGAGMSGTYGIACNGTMTPGDSAEQLQVSFMNTLFGDHADRPWKFVIHHRPIHSETTDFTHGGWVNADLEDSWGPVFDANQVTMVFSGHDHYYQRHKPLSGGREVDNLTGRHYIVTAGAGASLYDVKTGGTVAATKSAIHYVAVSVDGYGISMKAIEINSTSGDAVGTIDSISFSK